MVKALRAVQGVDGKWQNLAKTPVPSISEACHACGKTRLIVIINRPLAL
jgi:hypothetical protein